MYYGSTSCPENSKLCTRPFPLRSLPSSSPLFLGARAARSCRLAVIAIRWTPFFAFSFPLAEESEIVASSIFEKSVRHAFRQIVLSTSSVFGLSPYAMRLIGRSCGVSNFIPKDIRRANLFRLLVGRARDFIPFLRRPS